MDGARRTLATSVAAHLAASCVLGLLVWLLFGRTAFVNYDSAWSLNWMRELAVGHDRPDLERLFSPTPHPLSDLASGVLAPLSDAGRPAVGRSAETALVVSAMFWLGALGVVTFRLGAAWFGAAAGVVAAVLVLTREPVLSYGLRTYLDLPYAVFLLLALLAETRRPRNGARTVAWITLAGLLRPEAWLLAAAYVAYLALWDARPPAATTTVPDGAAGAGTDAPPTRGPVWQSRESRHSQSGPHGWVARVRVRPLLPLVAFSLVAPLGWIVEGLVLAGDPLQALTGTQENAADLDRTTGVRAAVEVMPRRLGEIVREPVLLAAGGGVLLSLALLRRRAVLGVGAAVAAGAGFFALALAGLPLLTRYLVFPATIVILFAAAGLLGWRCLEPGHRWRRPWQAFAVVALLALVVFLPGQVRRLDRLQQALALQQTVIGDLREVTGDVVAPVLTAGSGACPAGGADLDVALPNHRAVPQVLLWLGRPDTSRRGPGPDRDEAGPRAGRAGGTATTDDRGGRGPTADAYPAVGIVDRPVGAGTARTRVTLLPSSERVARGFILDKADNGRGLPQPPRGAVRAGTHGTWTVFGANRACAAALRARLQG